MRNHLFFLWFLLPTIFSTLALSGYGFAYKAGVTLSCLLIIFLAWWGRWKIISHAWLIILAFAFSIVGDGFLSHKGDSFQMFTLGIGFYFLAHLGYMIYAIRKGSLHKAFTAIVLSVYLFFFAIVLWPAIDDPMLLIAVLSYLLISCFSLGAAVNLKESAVSKMSYFVGIALILISKDV